MFKKFISAALMLSFVLGLSACHKVDNAPETTSSTTVTESVTTTEAESTTREETTTEVSTTVTTTAKPTTTKRVTTTKAATTAKPTTTKTPSTTQLTTATTTVLFSSKIEYDRKEDKSENLKLKYGVYVSRAITTYYKVLEDGSETVAGEDVAEVFYRIGYSAAYADLLPAVKENREKYSAMIDRVLEIINGYRAEKGVAPLKANENLMQISGARAEEIAWSGNHTHTRPNLSSWSTILKEGGITKGTAGENIGWGFETAEAVCEAWKNSPTHYENLMNPEFTETGIGIAADPDSDGKLCWAQHFLKGKEE